MCSGPSSSSWVGLSLLRIVSSGRVLRRMKGVVILKQRLTTSSVCSRELLAIVGAPLCPCEVGWLSRLSQKFIGARESQDRLAGLGLDIDFISSLALCTRYIHCSATLHPPFRLSQSRCFLPKIFGSCYMLLNVADIDLTEGRDTGTGAFATGDA